MNVAKWQTIIKVPETGIFDKATHEATIRWQKQWNNNHPEDLLRTDGVVDERTWNKANRS